MNRARELAVRKGLAIVEQYQDETSGHPAKTPLGINLNGVHLEQSKLDVIVRTKTSRLPWRGQFPPELVGYFLETVCRDFANSSVQLAGRNHAEAGQEFISSS